jgi:hypothetical protein
MASVNQTRPHRVNQMGKTHSKPLAAQHGCGMGTACYVWIGLKWLENFQGTYQEWNPGLPILWRSMSTNCATSHPIMCVVFWLQLWLLRMCVRTHVPKTTCIHSDIYRYIISGGMVVLLLDGPAPWSYLFLEFKSIQYCLHLHLSMHWILVSTQWIYVFGVLGVTMIVVLFTSALKYAVYYI